MAIQSLHFCTESIWKQQALIKALHIPECKGSHDYFKTILNEYRVCTFASLENFQNSRSAKLCTKMLKYRCHNPQKNVLPEVTEQKHKPP